MRIAPAEPPTCCEGQWRMAVHPKVLTRTVDAEADSPQLPSHPTVPDDPAGPAAMVPTPVALTPVVPIPEVSSSAVNAATDALELDNQSFTVRMRGQRLPVCSPEQATLRLAGADQPPAGPADLVRRSASTGDVWDGLNVEDSTIRGAVARLRKALKRRGHGYRWRGESLPGPIKPACYVMLRAQ